MPDKGTHLDLHSDLPEPSRRGQNSAKPFLGVQFACCGAYARVYPNHEQTAYIGHCPRCARKVRFEIGPGGSDSRFFTVQ